MNSDQNDPSKTIADAQAVLTAMVQDLSALTNLQVPKQEGSCSWYLHCLSEVQRKIVNSEERFLFRTFSCKVVVQCEAHDPQTFEELLLLTEYASCLLVRYRRVQRKRHASSECSDTDNSWSAMVALLIAIREDLQTKQRQPETQEAKETIRCIKENYERGLASFKIWKQRIKSLQARR